MENTANDCQRRPVLQKNSKNICMQLGQLQKSANQLILRNKKKYEQIVKYKPVFEYRLYKVHENQTLSKGVGRELLLRQMDKLLEEQNYLDRELSLIRIQNEDLHSYKEELLTNEITPYQALRSIWKRASPKYESAVDHIESLNEVVGHIRHSLKKITQIQGSSSEESQSEYLKYYAIERCASQTCNNCATLQQAKNQLRIKYQSLQMQYEDIKKKSEENEREISKKDEQIRKLTTKMMEREAQAHKKFFYLEERLMNEEHEAKQLRKFKEDLEKNAFYNQEENYQIIINTERDLAEYSQCITLELNCLLELLANNQIFPEELDRQPQFDYEQGQSELQLPVQREMMVISTDFMIPELSFGTKEKSREKALTKKTSMTDRPRTQRLKTMNHKLQSIEELEISSRKYVRTNQLTTKRNNRPNPFSFLENKCTASTVKMNDSPKNMEDSSR